MNLKPDDALTSPHMGHGQAICKAEVLNVRAGPRLTAQVLGVLLLQEAVDVWAFESDWSLIQSASGLTGWCNNQYLQFGTLVRGVHADTRTVE